jgi:hypothetical protein
VIKHKELTSVSVHLAKIEQFIQHRKLTASTICTYKHFIFKNISGEKTSKPIVFPNLRENVAIFPNSKGGVVDKKERKSL